MIENIIAATAAIAPADYGRGPVPDLQKISTKTMNSLVIAYSPCKSTARFRIAGDRPPFEKNVPPGLFYICGKDNSPIRDMREVLT